MYKRAGSNRSNNSNKSRLTQGSLPTIEEPAIKTPWGDRYQKQANQSGIDTKEPIIIKHRKNLIVDKVHDTRGKFRENIDQLTRETDYLRRENQRLIMQDQDNTTTNERKVNKLKQDIDRTRATSNWYKDDVTSRTARLHNLETEKFELNLKLESLHKQNADLRREMGEWIDNTDAMRKTEARCRRLAETNKAYTHLLLKHHIDYKAVLEKEKFPFRATPIVRDIVSNAGRGSPLPAYETKMKVSHSYTHLASTSRSLDEPLLRKGDIPGRTKVRRSMTQATPVYSPFANINYLERFQQNQETRKQMRANGTVQLPKIKTY